MIHRIAKRAEDQTGLRFYKQQIYRDLDADLLTKEQANDLLHKIEAVRGYASLQVILIAQIIITKSLFILPLLMRMLASNIIMTFWPFADKRTSHAHLLSPGIVLIRCIPGCAIMAANIAMLRAEPDLHDVALRFCEHAYRRLHLKFLIPIFVRPSMQAIRWLCTLNWPQLQKPS
jgi:hypothetical protein